jgi:hypothetical protein
VWWPSQKPKTKNVNIFSFHFTTSYLAKILLKGRWRSIR